MITVPQTLSEITHEALRVLYRELGVVNTVRFLKQFTLGFGDYTEERRELLDEESPEDVLNSLRQHQTTRLPTARDNI